MTKPTKVEEDARELQVYIQNKNVTTAWFLIITQLFYCFMYGFFIQINSMSILTSEAFVHTALLLVLVIVGFGLAFGTSYKLVWSNLGFNLLITALAIQTFFLINAFWTKAAVYYSTRSYFNVDPYTIALVPGQTGSFVASANMNEAIKCALACIVAFSFIIGRAGLMELYLMTTTGTIIYELARQTCLNNFPYQIGSIKIFLYGGTLGLMTSFVLHRLGRQANIIDHYNHWNNRTSMILNLLGALICWALFPLLTRDAYITEVASTQQVRVFTIVLSMSASGLFGVIAGYFRFGFKMVIYSMIGGGVSMLSASAYISNPVYAILFGLIAGFFQFFFLLINTKLKSIFGPFDPHAYIFIGQGFLGIFFQAIHRAIYWGNHNQLAAAWDSNTNYPQYILGNGAITIGMALILGFVIGSLLSCCSYHEEQDHYNDFTYWVRGDGLTSNQPQVVKDDKPQDYQIYVHEQTSSIKQKNAYL